MVKPSKRVKKAVNDLHFIKETILYACAGDADHYNTHYKEQFERIEDTLLSLAQNKKAFAAQLKKVWEEQND